MQAPGRKFQGPAKTGSSVASGTCHAQALQACQTGALESIQSFLHEAESHITTNPSPTKHRWASTAQASRPTDAEAEAASTRQGGAIPARVRARVRDRIRAR